MSESSKRHSKFLSLIFILKCLSKASVVKVNTPSIQDNTLNFNQTPFRIKDKIHAVLFF